MTKRILFILGMIITSMSYANAYQVISSKELGQQDAKNQNVIVKCTTETGKVSTQTCSLRRYAKCEGSGTDIKCNGWNQWIDLRNSDKGYTDWKTAANQCCRSKGLR